MPFLLLLALSAGVFVGEVLSAEPPILDVGEEVVIRTKEVGHFQLECQGSKEITWSWTSTLPDDLTEIVTHVRDNPKYPYVSTFTVRDPVPDDTGFYQCHYENAGNFETDKDNVARTYVYVDDGESVFLNLGPPSMVVRTNEKLVLDCRTTTPDAAVTLTKDGETIPLNAQHTRWDPKIGFIILSITVQDSGMYVCQSETKPAMQTIHVEIRPASHKLQSPSISSGFNQYFVVGEPFILNCTLFKETVEVALHWSYPNSGVMYPVNTSKHGEGDDRYMVSILHVPVASKNDSGTYTCTASAHQYDPSSDSLDIEVEDTLHPHVTVEVSSSEITVAEGDTLKWRADVFSFPPNPRIVYTDWRGQPIMNTSRIETEYDPSTSFSWLRIFNVTGKEHGLYTLTATTTDNSASGNATTTIKVRSKPYIEVMGVPEFVMMGQRLQITCVVQGYPLPSLVWRFQSCPDTPPTCSDFENIENGDVPLQYPPPGNIVMSNTTLKPRSSGHLRCSANNSLDMKALTVPVAISDINGLHVLRYTRQNTTKETLQGDDITLITNDRFLLNCGANKLIYKTVMLNVPQQLDIKVNESESEYSRLRDITVEKVTAKMTGEYLCIAKTHDGNTEVKKLIVTVLEESPVTFQEDSNMVRNRTIDVKENAPFFLNCTVNAMPKPTVTWTKDDKPLDPNSEFFDDPTVVLSGDMQRIELKYMKGKHQGVYVCKAENRVNRVTGVLTIVMPAAGLSTGGKVGLAVALIGITMLVIAVVILVRRVRTERKFRKSFRANELYLFQKGNIGQLNPDCSADEQAELLPYGQEWEVPRDQITLGKMLGSGAFGRVVKAKVTGLEGPAATTVAIKMCKSQSDPSQIRALALELKIMIHLGKHLNIVNLMGANTAHIGRGELWIMVEYCRFGNLLLFMHRHRRSFINQIDPNSGCIDPTKLTPDTTSIVSPFPSSAGSWQHTNSSSGTSQVTSATTNNPFILSPPPSGYLTPISPPLPVQQRAATALPPAPLTQSAPEGYNTPLSPPPAVDTHGGTQDWSSAASGSSNPFVAASSPPNSKVPSSSNPFAAGSSPPNYQVPLSPPPVVATPQVHNPLYNATFQNPTTGIGEEGLQIQRFNADGATSDSCCSDGKTVNTSVDSGSDGRVQNMYHSTTRGSSMSQGPMSPIEIGMLDSHGNAMVHEVGSVPGVNSPFTTTDLVCWAWQVAHGMEYLASRKVLHGDLAARNLLLADDNVVKISDFGLSREIYKKDVYMKKSDDLMPIKWISVEAIRDRIFSVQSDVWAFGVTLWEIFSLGSTPYPGIEVNNDFLRLLEDGYRMSCPKYANQEIYKLLLECWQAEPRDRPTFRDTLLRLDAMLRPDIKTEYLNMNDQYLRMNEERFKDQPDYLNMLTPPDYENMTNRDNDDDEEMKPQYLNMEVTGGERRGTLGQTTIQQQQQQQQQQQVPNEVVYCNMGNLTTPHTTSSSSPTNHYLPMTTTTTTTTTSRDSNTLEDDVFSPRPSEDVRFNFSNHQENTSSSSIPGTEDKPFIENVEPRDKTPDKTVDTEHSILITTNGRGNT